MALDLSQLTPDQLNSLGWLGGAQWGGSSPYSMAALQDPLGPMASNDADTKAAATIARRMRQQSPNVPPAPQADQTPDDSAFSTGAPPLFGSLAPSTSPLASSAGPVIASGAPPMPPAPPAAAPPLPPPQTIGPAPGMNNNAVLPPNSTPTIGNVPPQMIAPPPAAAVSPQAAPPQQQLAAGPSLLDKLGAGFANFGTGFRQGGLLGAIGGAVEGDTTGRRIDPIGQQNQTVDYLQRKGYAPDEARAIASNPDVLKAVLPAVMGMSTKEHVTIKDTLGNEIPLTFDQKSGRYFTADGQPYGANSGVGGTSAAAQLPMDVDPKSGRDEKFLAALSPTDRQAVIGVLNGDVNAQGRNMQKYLPLATRAEPGFSQQVYQSRLRTMNDFDPQGVSGKNVTAINTALGHIQGMYDTADKLGNLEVMPALNMPYNAIRSQLSPDFQKQSAAFRANAIGSSGELAKAFRSAGMSEADIQSWKNLFDINSSPATIKSAADAALHMLDTRVNAITDSYQRGMQMTGKQLPDLLSPQARAIHNRLLGIDQAPAPGAVAPTFAQPAPQQTAPQQQQPPAPPRVGEVQKGFRFVGGDPRDPSRWQKVNAQ